jgi:hypothetical protein
MLPLRHYLKPGSRGRFLRFTIPRPSPATCSKPLQNALVVSQAVSAANQPQLTPAKITRHRLNAEPANPQSESESLGKNCLRASSSAIMVQID